MSVTDTATASKFDIRIDTFVEFGRTQFSDFRNWVVLRKDVPRGVTLLEAVLLICCQ